MFVAFESGTSRHGNYGVNYMIAHPFYAEVAVPDGASGDYGYFALKKEIQRQARDGGVPGSKLQFWYDGQEGYLEPDAHAECEVMGW